jgi:hypothetical protein
LELGKAVETVRVPWRRRLRFLRNRFEGPDCRNNSERNSAPKHVRTPITEKDAGQMVATSGHRLPSDWHARTARYRRLHQRPGTTHPCAAHRASAIGESVSASNRATAGHRFGRPNRATTAADRQADRNRSGRGPMAGLALDDCRAIALAASRGETRRPTEFSSPRFSERYARRYRSRHETSCIVPCSGRRVRLALD